MAFNNFSAGERAWLLSRQYAHLATVSPDGVVDIVASP